MTRCHISDDRGNLPVAFISLYSRMAVRAETLGYALCLHGSLAVSGCDVVAVPWDERAVHPRVLIESLLELCGGGSLLQTNKAIHTAGELGRLFWTMMQF